MGLDSRRKLWDGGKDSGLCRIRHKPESLPPSDMFDKLLTRAHTQAQNELDEQLCRQRQTIQVSLTALRSLSRIILDDTISDEELRARLFGAVSRESW